MSAIPVARWRQALAALALAAVHGCQAVSESALRRDAERGDAEAQYELGRMHADDEYLDGVAQDDGEAVRWFRSAAEQGHPSAQYELARMLHSGEGALENELEALRWLRASAEQGHSTAQYTLGRALMEDAWERQRDRVLFDARGTPAHGACVPEPDLNQAIRWFRLAAEQRHPLAQFSLGFVHYYGVNCARVDDVEAMRLFRSAADLGHHSARIFAGDGPTRSDGERFGSPSWALREARLGDADAQHMLGLMYALGEGMPENDVHAFAWANVAAASGAYFAPELKDELRARMSPQRVVRAQELSAELLERIGGSESRPGGESP